MKILERLTKRVASTASIAVTDSVKTQVKEAAENAIPIVLSLAAVVAGVFIFRGTKESIGKAVGTTVSRMNVTTNNYFFGDSVKAEMIEKLLNQ